jgi:hypothetical protein
MPRFFIKPLKARSRASSLAQISGLAMMPLLVSGAAIAGPSNALVEALRLQQQQQGQAQGRAQTQTQAALTQGQAKVDTVMVDWRMLGGLNYESGEMTDTLKKLTERLSRSRASSFPSKTTKKRPQNSCWCLTSARACTLPPLRQINLST